MRTRLVIVGVLAVGILVGSALTQRIGPGDGAAPVSGADGRAGERIRVEVLNAGGVRGAARAATEVLRDAGFDVVTYQNAENFSETASVVLDRAGRPELATQVASALGIADVRTDEDSDLLLEVTVLLGPEWRVDQAQGRPRAEQRPWWDPRGYIGRPGP